MALVLILFAGALVLGHKYVDAATSTDNSRTPINNASIDPLLALDQATETVASRVTPAVVNIAVTSHAHEQAAEAQGDNEGEGDNPFSQFFGPGFGQQFGRGGPGKAGASARSSMASAAA